MRKLAGLASAAALGLSGQAFGYEAVGTLEFSWGGNAGGLADANSAYGETSDTTADIAWTANGTSALSTISDGTYFSALNGYNSRSYYDADYATTAQCAAGSVVPSSGANIARRKYGCRYTSNFGSGNPTFVGTPVSGQAAALQGARASGEITITDFAMTGTLTIIGTGDEPTGATTTTSPSGVRLSNSPGNGFAGFNVRSADGSPFGNYWQGVTTAATLEVNLTGTFSDTAWNITGGTVRFSDPGFACQQGGLGSTTDASAGTLCTSSTVSGGQSKTGTNLSWGWDVDGDGAGTTNAEIEVRSAVGGPIIETLAGVLASLTVNNGAVSTNSGEFRRALGSAGSGCGTYLVYDGTRVSCGTLTVGLLAISGSVTEIPVPAAMWLVAPALLAAGRYARRRKAS